MPDRERSRSPRRDRAPRGSSRDRDRDRDYDRRDRDRDRTYDRRDRDAPRRDGDRDDRPRPKKKTGGFNFKEKRRDENDDGRDGERRGGGSSGGGGGGGASTLHRGYRNRSPSPRSKRPKARDDAPDTSKPPTRAPAAASGSAKPGLEMIIVHVNDRLGTKAAIPCLPSDTIRQFKIIVAARIGREPHEILLKRQGMRPFKDMLTLADYEISNGVQLDLEVDTGD